MKIYLIQSDSHVLIDEKINEIIKKETNIITYHYGEDSLEDIIEEAGYVSLFGEEKLIIVKNADFFGKAKLKESIQKKLEEYLDHPYELTKIIFATYEDVDKRKTLTKKISKDYELIELKSPKGYNLLNAAKQKLSIYKIQDQTIWYMINATLNNYDVLISEINKLNLIYKKGDTITLEDIKKVLLPSASDNTFKFVDDVIAKNIKEVYKEMQDLESLKVDPFTLISMLNREYHLMLYYKIYNKNNTRQDEIAHNLNLKFDFQLKKLMDEQANYSIDEIKDIIVKLSKIDEGCKRGTLDRYAALNKFIIDIMEY